MMMIKRTLKPLSSFLSLLVISWSLLPMARAAIIDTGELLRQELSDSQRSQVMQLLQRQDVQQQLQAMGVDPRYASLRVASMTDAEIATLHHQVKDTPAGAGILEAAIFVFLILLVTDIMGYTDIFPFVKKGSAK